MSTFHVPTNTCVCVIYSKKTRKNLFLKPTFLTLPSIMKRKYLASYTWRNVNLSKKKLHWHIFLLLEYLYSLEFYKIIGLNSQNKFYLHIFRHLGSCVHLIPKIVPSRFSHPLGRKYILIMLCHFWNKRCMLDEMTSLIASIFAIFLEYIVKNLVGMWFFILQKYGKIWNVLLLLVGHLIKHKHLIYEECLRTRDVSFTLKSNFKDSTNQDPFFPKPSNWSEIRFIS